MDFNLEALDVATIELPRDESLIGAMRDAGLGNTEVGASGLFTSTTSWLI
jgi:hypothetical protein